MNFTFLRTTLLIFFLLASFLATQYSSWLDYYDNNLHVYFLDVGQGDSILIKTPDRKFILVDGGPGEITAFRVSEILPIWISEIDLAIVTHSHADHLGGFIPILEHYDINCLVYRVDDKEISKTEEHFRKMLDDLNIKRTFQKDIPVDCFDSVINIQNFYLLEGQLLRSSKSGHRSFNENLESIITTISYGDFDVILTGDAETPVLQSFLGAAPKKDLDIEVIKVPHHGAIDSFYPSLIHLLKPELAVISAGAKNRYGHPHTKVLTGYKNMGVEVLQTLTDGTVEIFSNGKDWHVVR